jgi:hypothetical protein
MMQARAGFAAIRIDDSRTLLVGGADPVRLNRRAEIYNTDHGSFAGSGALKVPRMDLFGVEAE